MTKKTYVIDTETTGFYPERGDRMVEIAAIELEGRVPTGRTFHSLINPERDIPEEVVRIHGIDNKKVEYAPLWASVANKFFEFIGATSDVVAHNAEFDMKFINYETQACVGGAELLIVSSRVICTKLMSMRVWPHIRKGHRLDDCCDRLNIDRSARTLHGALLDAELCTEVYMQLHEKMHGETPL